MRIDKPEVNISGYPKSVASFPNRAPLSVASAARSIIEGKVICDVGCGEGDLMACFAIYAQRCIGVEIDENRRIHAIRRGLDVRLIDFNEYLPHADVYYCWIGEKENRKIIQKIFKLDHACTILTLSRVGEHAQYLAKEFGGYLIEFPSLEAKSSKSAWNVAEDWHLCVIRKPASNTKTVSLTFDDRLKSHYTVAHELMKSHDFRGTFFVCNKEGLWKGFQDMHEDSLPWDMVKELYDFGHEIGNHTDHHNDLTKLTSSQIVTEIVGLERTLRKCDIPKPDSFCYPGYAVNQNVRRCIEEQGYRMARTAYKLYDDKLVQSNPHLRDKVHYYKPGISDRLTLLNTGIINNNYVLDHFISDVENISSGEYGVFTFHGFAKSTRAKTFEDIIEYLANNRVNVVPLSELPITNI